MRLLGIDPGTARLGWGVVDEERGQLQVVAYGILTTPVTVSVSARLAQLYTGLHDIIAKYTPAEAAVEELFFSRNVTTALAVGQARGVILLVLEQAGLAITEYKPRVIKQTVTGYGAAEKRQVQEMVRATLGLHAIPKPDDAADALALAICHAYCAPMARRLGTSNAKTEPI